MFDCCRGWPRLWERWRPGWPSGLTWQQTGTRQWGEAGCVGQSCHRGAEGTGTWEQGTDLWTDPTHSSNLYSPPLLINHCRSLLVSNIMTLSHWNPGSKTEVFSYENVKWEFLSKCWGQLYKLRDDEVFVCRCWCWSGILPGSGQSAVFVNGSLSTESQLPDLNWG